MATLVQIDQTDSDNTASGFGGGVHNDTVWDAANSWLELTSAGQTAGLGGFTSRIIDAGADAGWSSISWIPQNPFFKELPDNAQAESGYATGNTNMSDNVLLLHMNDSSGAIVDSSGAGHNGTYNGALYSQTGRLNTAIGFDRSDDYVVIDSVAVDTASGANNTVEYWMYWDGVSGVMPMGWNTSYDLWINGGCFGFNTGQGNIFGVSSAGLANRWVHVAAVFYNGVPSSDDSAIYIDGVKQSIGNCQGTTTGSRTVTPQVIVSGWGPGGYRFGGNIDEFAVYDRALTDSEVLNHYFRGALRLKFQVRSCNDDVCSGESFIGPDGTSATYYTELLNSTISPPSMSLSSVIDNKYFQYKVDLETDNDGYSPELSQFAVGPDHYESTSPTIVNKAGIEYATLTGFSEELGGGNTGDVTYQISNDSTHWYYWNNGWLEVSGDNWNAATIINDRITDFVSEVGDGYFYFKAKMSSDGTQQVELDTVTLQYTPPASGSGDDDGDDDDDDGNGQTYNPTNVYYQTYYQTDGEVKIEQLAITGDEDGSGGIFGIVGAIFSPNRKKSLVLSGQAQENIWVVLKCGSDTLASEHTKDGIWKLSVDDIASIFGEGNYDIVLEIYDSELKLMESRGLVLGVSRVAKLEGFESSRKVLNWSIVLLGVTDIASWTMYLRLGGKSRKMKDMLA